MDGLAKLRREYDEVMSDFRPGDPPKPTFEEWLAGEVLDWRGNWRARVMTTAEVEKLFTLSRGSVKKAILRGDIPAVKAGHDWLVLRSVALLRWSGREV